MHSPVRSLIRNALLHNWRDWAESIAVGVLVAIVAYAIRPDSRQTKEQLWYWLAGAVVVVVVLGLRLVLEVSSPEYSPKLRKWSYLSALAMFALLAWGIARTSAESRLTRRVEEGVKKGVAAAQENMSRETARIVSEKDGAIKQLMADKEKLQDQYEREKDTSNRLREDVAMVGAKKPVEVQLVPSTVGAAVELPNRYVCTTPVTKGTRHGLLVEFGALRYPTDGFFGEVDGLRFDRVEDCFGRPLRTDYQHVNGVTMGGNSKRGDDFYRRSFNSPSVTPESSFYFYFEGNEPMNPYVIYFTSPVDAADPQRLNQVGAAYARCPRDRN